jgi:hypothetical protein
LRPRDALGASLPAIRSRQVRRNQQAIRARPSISQKTRVRTNKLNVFSACVRADNRCSLSGEEGAAGPLDARQQGTRYIQLPHMRLVVVHEKYWRAILHKDKLIEFRSSKQPVLLEAGQCLLFARAMCHRRNRRDTLLFALVLKMELLDVGHAREIYPS